MLCSSPRFGQQIELTRTDFADTIDHEQPTVTIIVHVYEQVRTETITPLELLMNGGHCLNSYVLVSKRL
jgi:hypothetical protein